MNTFLTLLLNGISLGAIYALIALGFAVIFKASEVVSFMHGSLLLFGAFTIAKLNESIGFFPAVIGDHFRQDEAGQGFLDSERKQAHGRRLAGSNARSKRGFHLDFLTSWKLKRSCPRQRAGECFRHSKSDGNEGQQKAGRGSRAGTMV